MDKRPTLVFIASRFPYPLEKGDKLRAFNLLKGLSKTHQIHLIALSNEDIKESWYKEVKPFTSEITVYKLNPILQWIRIIFCLFTNQPFQLAYFTSLKIKRKIKKQLVALGPDHIFCQMIRPAEYVKNYHHCHKTIDYMDTLSVGMERRAQKASWATRWIYKMEAIRLKEYEQRIFNYFEFQTMISQQDVHYIAHPDQRKIHVIPNGIDTDFFRPMKGSEAPYDLVFVGNLSYAPNIDAMQWFAAHVLKHEPNWRLLIAGANPSGSFIQSLKKYPNINGVGIDGSVDGFPYELDRFKFIKKFVGSTNDDNTTNLTEYTNKYNNIFLKMDIEEWEFEWLQSVTPDILNKFTDMFKKNYVY